MILTGIEQLETFKKIHSDVGGQIDFWKAQVSAANWKMPLDVKNYFPKASIIGGSNIVFDFGWNKYRLWVQIAYKSGIVVVKKIGTHKEYDSWLIK